MTEEPVTTSAATDERWSWQRIAHAFFGHPDPVGIIWSTGVCECGKRLRPKDRYDD